jgi:hypothetical protein
MWPTSFKKRTADIAAAFEEIGQTRGRNSQVNGPEADHGFKRVAGKRLLYRPLTGSTDAPPPVGSARATSGDVTRLEKNFAKFCGN